MLACLTMTLQTNLYFAFISVTIWTVSGNSQEASIHRAVFKDYNTCIRPVKNPTTPITVEINLVLQSVYGLEEKRQILHSSVGIQMSWVDEFLSWNAKDFDNIYSILVPSKKIWTPDICIENDLSNDKCMSGNSIVQVNANGKIHWWINKELETKCDIDITKYPFDHQTCEIRIGTLYSSDQQILIESKLNFTSLCHFDENGEWKLLGKVNERVQTAYGRRNFTHIGFRYNFKRSVSFHVNNIIIPLIILTCLNLACYYIPFDCGSKLSASIDVFLAFALLLVAINDNIPSSSGHNFILGLFMTSQLVFSAFTVIVEAFLSFLYCYNSDISLSLILPRLYSVIHGNKISKQRREPKEQEDSVMCENSEIHPIHSDRGSRRYRKRNSTTTSSVRSKCSPQSDCSPPSSINWTSFTIDLESKAFIVMLGLNFLSYTISLSFFLV